MVAQEIVDRRMPRLMFDEQLSVGSHSDRVDLLMEENERVSRPKPRVLEREVLRPWEIGCWQYWQLVSRSVTNGPWTIPLHGVDGLEPIYAIGTS